LLRSEIRFGRGAEQWLTAEVLGTAPRSQTNLS
jgi:hypothetical protein